MRSYGILNGLGSGLWRSSPGRSAVITSSRSVLFHGNRVCSSLACGRVFHDNVPIVLNDEPEIVQQTLLILLLEQATANSRTRTGIAHSVQSAEASSNRITAKRRARSMGKDEPTDIAVQTGRPLRTAPRALRRQHRVESGARGAHAEIGKFKAGHAEVKFRVEVRIIVQNEVVGAEGRQSGLKTLPVCADSPRLAAALGVQE